MKGLTILLLVMLPLSFSWGKTVKCYMAGDKGKDQVVIATPKGLSNMQEINDEMYRRYAEHGKTINKLGNITQFECVEFERKFSSKAANTRFSEMQY